MQYKTIKDKIYANAKTHIVDSTALVACSHPLFAAYETQVAGMSDEVSFGARLTVTIFTYAGLGYVIGKIRDKSRKIFKISDQAKEGIQQLHDSLYLAAINIPLSLGVYGVAGETDWKKIGIGTAMSVIYGLVLGGWTGYSIDAYRDMTGIKENNRKLYPKAIKNRSPKTKKTLAIGFTLVSIAATLGVYEANSEQPVNKEPAVIERKLNTKDYQTIDNLLVT